MKSNPIGIFDSGIGGLTIAHNIKKRLPYEKIIYFGDTKHLPYGEKSNEAIKQFSEKIIAFLKTKKCKAIIIACNSASSVAFNELEKKNKKVMIFNVVDPIINYIKNNIKNCKIGVIGTKATVRSKIYKKKITRISNNNVSSLATPLLAPMIEEGYFNEAISNTVINNYLSNAKLKNITHLILACTHYPLIQQEINNYYNGCVSVFQSSKIITDYITNKLRENDLLNNNKRTIKDSFYVSNFTKSFEKSAKLFFKEKIQLKEIDLDT